MAQVSVHEAQTHLSELLERVEAGEEVIIARGSKPVARLCPLNAVPQLGALAGTVEFRPGWDDPVHPDELLGE